MRELLFRVPMRDQNDHFRWMYTEWHRGEWRTTWQFPQPCNCSTHELNEGFKPVGEPQQFTGSLDRNGTKIFEGDIIQHAIETPFDVRIVRGTMEWNKATMQFGVWMPIEDNDPLGNHFEVKESVSGRPVVVGHIYQTKEEQGHAK